jgi:CBS-domain-containing membrane protein
LNPSQRIENLRIGDIMIPLGDYPTVTPDNTLRQAIEKMERSQLEVDGRKSLPRVLLVMEASGELAGTVRRRDIMRGLEPRHLVTRPLNYRKKLFDVSIDPNLSELSFEKIVKGVREQANQPVRGVMRPIEVALARDDHIIKGVYEMVSYGLTLLPVIHQGKVLGVVRSVELFRELAHIVLAEDGAG